MSKKTSEKSLEAQINLATQAYKKHANRLRKRKGVVDVAIGFKCTNGLYGIEQLPKKEQKQMPSPQIAIIIYVEKKLSVQDLYHNQKFEKSIDGIPIDVVEIPIGESAQGVGFNQRFSKLEGGIGIGLNSGPSPGTLGVIVKDRSTNAKYALTCAHIAVGLKVSNGLGGEVFQPPSGLLNDNIGVCTADGRDGNNHTRRTLDCATVSLNPVDTTRTVELGKVHKLSQRVSSIVPAREKNVVGKMVKKVGAVTGKTTGEILTKSPYQDSMQNIFFKGLFKLRSSVNKPFADHGDSGSFVYMEKQDGIAAVGLVQAVDKRDPRFVDVFIVPMQLIAAHFKIKF